MTTKRPMNNRSWMPSRRALFACWLALLAAVALAACGDGDTETANGAADEHLLEEGEHAEESGDVVLLDSAALAMTAIQLGQVETVETSGLPVTGTITYDANRVSHIGPRTEGRIVLMHADVGNRVRGGQALAILESPEVGQIRAEEQEAEALLEIAREHYEREQRLEQQGISSRRELLNAQAELRRAEAALQSARERLRVLGAGQGQGGQFALTAPFPGVVVAREASLGEVASSPDRLFTVADLSRLWIELDIFERSLTQVSEGQPVRITTAAYPGRTFLGEIVYVGDILDPATRTVRARVEIVNEGGVLRPGMFARAVIETSTGQGTAVPAAPRGAVQDVEGRTVVWVPSEHSGEFRAQPVEIGEDLGNGRVAIRSGLESGQLIVTQGAFTLTSEVSRGEFGGHAH